MSVPHLGCKLGINHKRLFSPTEPHFCRTMPRCSVNIHTDPDWELGTIISGLVVNRHPECIRRYRRNIIQPKLIVGCRPGSVGGDIPASAYQSLPNEVLPRMLHLFIGGAFENVEQTTHQCTPFWQSIRLAIHWCYRRWQPMQHRVEHGQK